MENAVEQINNFWIEEVGTEGWYTVSDALDSKIKMRFGELWYEAISGKLDAWQTTAKGCLALLILTDQFSRNMFRGTGQAFSSDRFACRIAKSAIARGMDLSIPEPERQFFYLPLMHSEILADQESCVRQFMLKMPQAGGENLPHAVNHREVIRRFGRFPSRNAAMGRTDSDAELAYRAEGGYMS